MAGNAPSNGPEEDRSLEAQVQPPAIPEPQNPPVAVETKEVTPELKLEVAGPCKNPEGRYVGLSKVQRDKLGVEVGGNVELFDASGKSFGLFSVGAGSKELLKEGGKFTVNGVAANENVTVRKPSAEIRENRMSFGVAVNVDIASPELQGDALQKHEDRMGSRREKIAARFPELASKGYVVVPSAVATALGIKGEKGATILPISRGKVRFAGVEHEMAVVPSGDKIGFDKNATAAFHIPAELKEMHVRVDNGVLVID